MALKCLHTPTQDFGNRVSGHQTMDADKRRRFSTTEAAVDWLHTHRSEPPRLRHDADDGRQEATRTNDGGAVWHRAELLVLRPSQSDQQALQRICSGLSIGRSAQKYAEQTTLTQGKCVS